MKAAADLKGPTINSIPIYDATIQPDREKKSRVPLHGDSVIHWMPIIFQRLIYREVGENPQGERRMLPKGLIFQRSWFCRSHDYFKRPGTGRIPQLCCQYEQNAEVRIILTADTWHQNLYWGCSTPCSRC
jgi:hypothetical protein